MAKSAPKVPVTKRALLQRLNRALAKEGQQLKATRGERWLSELGEFYALDVQRNAIVAKHVDIEEWAREMEVLKPYESLEE